MNYKLKKDKFRTALLNNGMSITDISNKSKVSTVTLDKIINHEGFARAKTCLKIATALNTNVTELFE